MLEMRANTDGKIEDYSKRFDVEFYTSDKKVLSEFPDIASSLKEFKKG